MSGIYHAEIVINDTTGDNITLIGATGADTLLNLTVESPWSGDTETGFGRDVTVILERGHAKALRDAIDVWLKPEGGE